MLSKSLAMAIAVALSLAAPLASPHHGRAAAQETITSEPLRVMTIRVAPGEAAAVVDAIAQRARAEGYAVRTGADPDGTVLAIYHVTTAIHVVAAPADADRLEFSLYEGTYSPHPRTLQRWDGIMADLCGSAHIVRCETTVSWPSAGTHDVEIYRAPLFLDLRIWTKPGGADILAGAVLAYGEAQGLAVRSDPDGNFRMVDDHLYVSGTAFQGSQEDFFFLSVQHGASMPTKAEVSAVVDGLREVVRGLDLDMEISEDGPDRSAEGG